MMDNSLVIALGITAIGMTLLFLALALFYGLLSLMTAVIKDRPVRQTDPVEVQEVERGEEEALLQAVAIAVALARAEAEQGAGFFALSAYDGVESSEPVSPWWALHHQRQVALNPNARRAQ